MELIGSSSIDFRSLPAPQERFELLEIIGEGTYGEVYSATDLSSTDERKVAVKILENLSETIEEAEGELMVLNDYSLHPNLPLFYGLFFKPSLKPEESQLWFVMELCAGGSVTDLVQGMKKYESRHLTELQIAYILHEVIDALIHLHQHDCIHRDVKGHNILLTEDGRVKLVDFGVSAHLPSPMAKRNTSVGTPYWMAPEVIACERQKEAAYDIRCDVWSLGITAIEVAEAEPPLADLHPMRALFQIPRNPPPELTKPQDWSQDFNDFLSECLVKDMDLRPFMVEVKKHPFIEQVGPRTDAIRLKLKAEIELVRALGTVRREPEVTTKHGKLKTDRRASLQTIFVDDLASLACLNEETILEQLFHRFEQRTIYTYIGDILLAINPYQEMGIYTDFYQFKYRGTSAADASPHIFGMADQAYHSMLHQKKGQSIVITGESGAGKTESAKFLLQQLVYLGKAPNRNLEAKILQVNPIMEAFGNAATVMNRNSSRFGKYLNLTFTRTGKITGAEISVYLLEESRVDQQELGETNFHIFYYIIDGLENNGARNLFHLFKKSYEYLKEIDDNPATIAANVLHFQQIEQGFQLLGFREDEIFSIYEILIAILLMGEIDFDFDDEGCSVKNSDELNTVASLLGISTGDLGVALTSRSVVTGGESFVRRYSVEEAVTMRDSLARGLYNRLFQWIVNQINALLGISRAAYGDPLSIGILDIFGFESCHLNSLAQLCINLTNEQLQYYFNQHVFSWEQQEYMAEGINIDVIPYADNTPILELGLGRPLGILAILDEEAQFPKATDWTFKEKLNSNLATSKFYRKSKSESDLTFEVRHYAGRIQYCVKDFVQKNRSWNSPELIELLRNSKVETVRILFRCLLTKSGHLYVASRRKSGLNSEELKGLASQTRNQQTVASQFRHSLNELMSKLLTSAPHFVRCIKPNDHGLPNTFDLTKVLTQLRYNGIFETVRIRQLGYSHRFTFVEFLKSYCFLAFNFYERVVADMDSCRLLLIRLKLDDWALGKTKVFLKYYHVEYLAKLCEQQIRRIIYIQACVRRWLAQVRLRKGMWMVAKTVVSTQRAASAWKRLAKQAAISKENIRKSTDKKRSSWLRTQVLGMEEIHIPDDEEEQERAAILIQSHIRGFLVRKKWGPVLEERIKRIVSTHKTADSAQKALEEEGLSEEDAAQVLQRYYRKWKVSKQSSFEEVVVKKLNPADDWNAPFRAVEKEQHEIRSGRNKKREKVNMAAHRKEMILAGLASQEFENQARDTQVARGWQNVITGASQETSNKGSTANQPPRKMSKFGKHLLSEALENKIRDLRQSPTMPSKKMPVTTIIKSQVPVSTTAASKVPAVGTKMAKVAPNHPISAALKAASASNENKLKFGSFELEPSDAGPIDFRKFLRKTDHCATDTLRRRKAGELQ